MHGADRKPRQTTSDRAVILERGAVVHAADSATLLSDRAALETYLGITDSGARRFGRKKQH